MKDTQEGKLTPFLRRHAERTLEAVSYTVPNPVPSKSSRLRLQRKSGDKPVPKHIKIVEKKEPYHYRNSGDGTESRPKIKLLPAYQYQQSADDFSFNADDVSENLP